MTHQNKKDMIPKFYILEENELGLVKQYVIPEQQELRNAKSQMKEGMEKGVVSDMNLFTSTIYWEL